ncbi:hypothetical protein AB9E19_34125, partial [Rhizobium leguminosarum]
NRLRILAERDVAVDLGPLVQKNVTMAEQGFSDTILKLAQVNGKQVGLAFATSSQVVGGFAGSPPAAFTRSALEYMIGLEV